MATRRCGQGGGCNTPEIVARNKRRAKEYHDAFVASYIAKKRREEAVEDVKEFGKKNVWVIVGIASVVTAYFIFRKKQ